MRFALLPILLFTAISGGAAQAPFGGCADGSERGFVRVTRRAELIEWDTGRAFMIVLPGDELRLCRFERQDAIITLWSAGYGYRLPKATIDSATAATMRTIAKEDIGCIDRDILATYAAARARPDHDGGRGLGKSFLKLARSRKITLSQISTMTTDITGALGRGESAASLTACRTG